MQQTLTTALIPALIAFLVSFLLAPIFIPWLHKLKFGQQILEDGPVWHKKKSGTPTMGGLIFIAGIVLSAIVGLLVRFDLHYAMMVAVAVGFGVIGFIDDYIKVVKKRNLGLTAWQKLLLQTLLAAVYVIVLNQTGDLNTEILIPFTGKMLHLPWWLYIPLIFLVVLATDNSVNLTDGLDGLAASVTAIVALFFTIVGACYASSAATWFGASIVGGLLAFLCYNHYPAKVFMGDTGSLFLGGAISVLAIGLRMPLILIIVGFVYLFEALSVILQVISFQTTGKRIFKMSPIHHHFEMCGWSEKKIVLIFSLVTLVLSVIGFFAVFLGEVR